MQHSCGAIRDIIPFLIEDGVDVLDPVQTMAAGMDLAGLVRDFGDRLTFHGAVDTQRTLPFGSTDDVRTEVRSYLDLTRGCHQQLERFGRGRSRQLEVDAGVGRDLLEIAPDLLGRGRATEDPVAERDEDLPHLLDHSQDVVALGH